MGVNSLQGDQQAVFLIGRALDGPLLPTARAAERVRKRSRHPQCPPPTPTRTQQNTPDPKAEGVCTEPLRQVVVCRVVFDAVGAQRP